MNADTTASAGHLGERTEADGRRFLTWDGLVVPHAARWSGEIQTQRLDPEGNPVPGVAVLGRLGSAHGDLPAGSLAWMDGNEDRDLGGILWTREGIGRAGEPQFSQLNAHRQRQCMTRGRCQVCGGKITQDVINWLLPVRSLHEWEGDAITDSPPTCDACIPLAVSLCPHLRASDWFVLRVLAYEIWGVRGQAFDPEQPNTPLRRGVMQPYLRPSRFAPHHVLAQQQVVQFTKFAAGTLNEWRSQAVG